MTASQNQSTSKGRPRSKPKAERREEFLSAALDLFLSQGYEATSVEEITRVIGVAKGTFYLYFGGKEDLLLALREHFREQGRVRLEQLFTEDSRPFEEQVETLVEFAFDFYSENWEVFDLVYRRFPGELSREKEETRTRYAQPVANIIRKALARGEADTAGGDPLLFAHLILGAIEENAHSFLISSDRPDREALKQSTKTFIHKALAPPKHS